MSLQIAVVTSCSAKGWDEYGRMFVDSFLAYWPSEITLHLVSEDHLLGVPVSERIMLWPLWERSKAAEAFHLRHRDNARMHGKVQISGDRGWSPSKLQRGYNFRYDVYRFAKKVFAVEMAALHVGKGRLLWIDADVRTFAVVPYDLLTSLLPSRAALSCLDRGSYHSECGFVGYNLDHPDTLGFIGSFARLYDSDEVLQLGEWHDSWVFDWLRKELNIPTHAIPHNSRHHPFVNSVLGDCMDHLKGARKDKGRTPVAEVLSSTKRRLPYWSAATP